MTIFPEDKETETEIRGLCAAEVEERIRQGKDNRADVGTGLTTAEIIRSNTLLTVTLSFSLSRFSYVWWDLSAI